MALSQSSKYPQKQRDKLFHNKYKYKTKFSMSGASRTYWHRTLQTYEKSVEENKQRWGSKTVEHYEPLEIDAFMKFKRKYLSPAKTKTPNTNKFDNISVTTCYASVTVFSNDEQVIKDIEALGFGNPETTEAVVTIPRGTMYFKRPPAYTHRIYLKSKKVDADFKDSMNKFLNQYQEVQACGALKRWLRDIGIRPWMRSWSANSYFIEFNGEQFYTLMMLYFDSKYLGEFYELHQSQ